MALKIFMVVGGEKMPLALPGDTRLHFGMAAKVILQTLCNNIALPNQLDMGRGELPGFFGQQRVVGTGKQQGINLSVLFK